MTVLGQLVTVAPTDATSWLRLARTVLQIRPRDDRESALLLDRASTAAYIAYNARNDARPGSRQPGGARQDARRPQAVAAGARRHAACPRHARNRRPARPIRAAAQRIRLPHARLFGRFRRHFAARLLPVLGRTARRAHRFLALRRGRRPGQAGDLGQRQAALRRRPQARRALRRSRCAPGCRRRCARRWRNRPTSPSSCATASRSCASPARPMCCRAPASAAFRCSASTPARSCCRSIASATAI